MPHSSIRHRDKLHLKAPVDKPESQATAENIGIIAGGGQFPRLIAQDARACGLGVVICGFHGHTDAETANCADKFEMIHLGQLNRM
ncbi:MAG: hypothetical protein J6W10_07275, partial [Kiritimatiellae bacterium]|nr:hypothetical protein [Kiritimatiellia bacterium]